MGVGQAACSSAVDWHVMAVLTTLGKQAWLSNLPMFPLG